MLKLYTMLLKKSKGSKKLPQMLNKDEHLVCPALLSSADSLQLWNQCCGVAVPPGHQSQSVVHKSLEKVEIDIPSLSSGFLCSSCCWQDSGVFTKVKRGDSWTSLWRKVRESSVEMTPPLLYLLSKSLKPIPFQYSVLWNMQSICVLVSELLANIYFTLIISLELKKENHKPLCFMS